MNIYSIKDLRTETKAICEEVATYGEAVVTNNGKPALVLLDVKDGDVEEMLDAIRQARAMIAVNRMQETAAKGGFLSEDEINREIKAARKAKK